MRTHKRSFTSPVIFLALTATVMVLGCRKEEPEAQYPQQQYPAQQQYPQQQYPAQQQYPPQQYPPAQPATQAPPGGVPCQTDADPQCPFGRCIAGKCGGCITAEHCKPAAACMQTPVGMACVPAGMPGAPQ